MLKAWLKTWPKMWSDVSPRMLWPSCKHGQSRRSWGCWETRHSPEGTAFLRPLKGKEWVMPGCIPVTKSKRITNPTAQWKRNKKSQGRRAILPLEKEIYFNKADFCSWLLRIMYQTQTGLIWSGTNAGKHQEGLVHWDAITFSYNTVCPPGLEWERLWWSEQLCWISAAKSLKKRVSLINHLLAPTFSHLDVMSGGILFLSL